MSVENLSIFKQKTLSTKGESGDVEAIHILEANGSQNAIYIPEGQDTFVLAARSGRVIYGPPVRGKSPKVMRYIAVNVLEIPGPSRVIPYGDFFITIVGVEAKLSFGEVRTVTTFTPMFVGRAYNPMLSRSTSKSGPSKDKNTEGKQKKQPPVKNGKGVPQKPNPTSGKGQTKRIATTVPVGSEIHAQAEGSLLVPPPPTPPALTKADPTAGNAPSGKPKRRRGRGKGKKATKGATDGKDSGLQAPAPSQDTDAPTVVQPTPATKE